MQEKRGKKGQIKERKREEKRKKRASVGGGFPSLAE
jgi:hypothetical protein